MYLTVANLSDQPVTLQKCDVIGHLHCVNKVTEMSSLNVETITDMTKARAYKGYVKLTPTTNSVESPNGLTIDLSNLSTDQKRLVKMLLSEYRDILSTGQYDVGCTSLLQHDIETNVGRCSHSQLRLRLIKITLLIQMLMGGQGDCPKYPHVLEIGIIAYSCTCVFFVLYCLHVFIV